jgi:hypothetical protein
MILRQNERVAARIIEGRAVLVTIEDNRMIVLNPTGTFLWERADGRSLDDVAREMASEFDIDLGRAKADCMTFARDLIRRGALLPFEAASA